MLVELTHAQRGVGDLEVRNASGDRKWYSGRHYVSTDTLPTGYVKYGAIYGFEKNGAAMIVALEDSGTGVLWCKNTGVILPTIVSDNATTKWGKSLNGLSGSYKCMNVARAASLCRTGSNNTTATTHPSNAYYQGGSSAPNTEAVFLANEEAVNKYGTYEAYIAQTRPLLKGEASGVFAKRCGKENTKALAEDTTNTYPAAQYAHNYVVSGSGDVAGNWWLPDMYELAIMMADEHYNLHKAISGVSASAAYWSCVAFSSSVAWFYGTSGLSSNDGFTYTWLRARPVTLSE